MRVSKVLIVDDDKISNVVSTNVITRIKFTDDLIVKTDGNEALDYLRKECSQTSNFPDLILLDLKMPGMDGFEFLEEFEFLCKGTRKEIVVVILTESKNPDDYMKLIKLGHYYTLSKPLSTQKLEDIYHRYFRNRNIMH